MTDESTGVEEWRVTGMDCGACAARVRGAVEQLPGVSGVDVALMAERLRLDRDAAKTSRAEIEGAVRRMGFGISQPGAAPETPQAGFVLPDGATSDPRASPQADPAWYETRKGRMVIGSGVLLLLAWAVELSFGGVAAQTAFVLATMIGVAPVARTAWASARAGMPFTIEMLMTIAALGALAIGAAGEAALVVFLFAVGEMLERVAAGRARESIRALSDVVPRAARLVEGARIREVPASDLALGQIVQVRPGDRVPADGTVFSGASGVDESPVTGESVPQLKEQGAEIFAGSINGEAELRVRVERAAEDNTIARIVRLVEEAESARAPTERFIDRFSRWYMPAVVGTAALVAILPPLIGGAPWETWIYRGLALLLIGCPCALVISVPASIASALSAGARRGLLMKGGAVVEAAARTTLVAFDKTGTLTTGRPQVTDVIALSGTAEDLVATAAGVESGASHPLGRAILDRAQADGLDCPVATEAGAIPGRGAFATLEGTRWTVGAPPMAAEAGLLDESVSERIAALETEGKTVVAVFAPDRLAGLLALRDEPRLDAARAVRALHDMGVEAVMLTGDNARTAAAIARRIGLDHRAGLLPEDKVAVLRELTRHHRVTMVGDGINDAPALATAHVGLAMGSGTDVALETADGALLRDRVADVAAHITLARSAMTNIRQNVAIALGLKAVFLVTTILGITGLWIAILADTGATVLVTLNALRLLASAPDRDMGADDAPVSAKES